MAKYPTENIHTVALVGHGGAGKTTLAETLLWKTGVIGAMGSTERGNTVCDFDPLEKTYGHSLNSSVVNFPYKGIHVHLVDTPGMPDYAGQSIAALAGVDLAVIVINAQTGIELNTKVAATAAVTTAVRTPRIRFRILTNASKRVEYTGINSKVKKMSRRQSPAP